MSDLIVRLSTEDRAAIVRELADELERRGVVTGSGENGARWLTLEQAAERLGCSPDAVRMRASRGRLETRRQGRRVYVAADSVDRLS